MIELVFVAIVGVVLFALFVGLALSLVFKAVVWLVLFPLRLIFGILLLPLILLKALLGGLFMTVFAIVGVVLALAFAAVLAVPLVPLLAVAFLVWLLLRAGSRPALVR